MFSIKSTIHETNFIYREQNPGKGWMPEVSTWMRVGCSKDLLASGWTHWRTSDLSRGVSSGKGWWQCTYRCALFAGNRLEGPPLEELQQLGQILLRDFEAAVWAHLSNGGQWAREAREARRSGKSSTLQPPATTFNDRKLTIIGVNQLRGSKPITWKSFPPFSSSSLCCCCCCCYCRHFPAFLSFAL